MENRWSPSVLPWRNEGNATRAIRRVNANPASKSKPVDQEVMLVGIPLKKPKGHGTGKQIEGNFKPGDTVIVVDDVITTGGSTLKAFEARGIHELPLFTRSTLPGE